MTVSKLVVIVGLLSVASANTVLMAQTTNPIAGRIRCRLYRKKMASRCSRARESFHGMERPSQFLASKPT